MALTELTKNLLRIFAGLMFWQHGAQKLFGWLGGNAVGGWFSWPLGFAGLLEFFGGALILLGLFTRPVAFLLAGQMAVAFWWRHFPNGFWPIQNGGELAVLYTFIFLFLVAHGGGDFSVDGWRKKRGPSQ
ncbi:MAG: DoxX family protein [Gemmatimonadota bacterium]